MIETRQRLAQHFKKIGIPDKENPYIKDLIVEPVKEEVKEEIKPKRGKKKLFKK